MPGPDEKLFGAIAIGEGYISREELDECITLQLNSGNQKTLWEILIEKSYIDKKNTNEILEKVEHKKTILKAKSKVEKFFGDIAISKGYCTAEKIHAVIEEQKKQMQNGRNQRLGELCVESGVLTSEQVADILAEQDRNIVVCKGCGSAYNVEGFAAGKRWRCKVCNSILEVPGAPAFASVPLENLLSEQIEKASVEKAPRKEAEPEETTGKKPATRFGNYYIIEKIARGGMGIIYKARQRGLDRIVALKVLLAGESASEETINRFYLEAKSVAKLRHQNIVPIHEVGIHDGKHFFTMDFIHGDNLRYIILNEKTNIHWSLETTAKVAKALHYAHEHGVVHRDVKPENILIDETGEPQVTDFGLAKDVDMDANLTRAGVIMGTPAYMSPEQARGERASVDHRSDIYSLGAVLYELLTGKQLFEFEGPIGLNTLLKTIAEDPLAPRKVNSRVPREVETIILKAINKEPERRYQSAREFAEDIERFLTGEPILAKPPSFSYRTWKKIKKYKVVSVSLLSAIIAIIIVAVYFINKQIEDKRLADEKFMQYVNNAGSLLAKGEYQQAKEFYSKADVLKPRHPEVIRGLTKVEVGLVEKEKQRQRNEAKKRASLAVVRGGEILEEVKEFLNQEKIFEAKNRLWDALREFDRALTNDTENENARQGKYSAAVELGQLNMMDREFGVAGFVFSFAEGLGIDDKMAEELVASARKARLKAEHFEKLLSQADKFVANGEWDEALRQFELAIEFEGITPDKKKEVQDKIIDVSYSRYFWEGENLRKKGGMSAAIQAYLKAESYKKTPEVAEKLRDVHYDQAVKRGNKHLETGYYKESLKSFHEAEIHARDKKEITELIGQCRESGYKHYFSLAVMAKDSLDWSVAIAELESALSFRPERQEARKLKFEVSAAASCPESMVFVFSRKINLGSAVLDDRNPLHEVFVDAFYMDKFEVTNSQFMEFVAAGSYSDSSLWDTQALEHLDAFVDRTGKPGPSTWQNGSFPQGKESFPVTGVSWYEARAYARWKKMKLPTEEEWEIAASFDPANETMLVYPWGDSWDPAYGNFSEDEPTKVGRFPKDRSPVGCYDMAGNAFEWTDSTYKQKFRVIRGGSVGLSESTLKRYARNAKRKCPEPPYRSPSTGFRCALTPGK